MAEHLQGLLNKIQEEGLKKAEEEKKAIIDAAEKKAKKIVADAEKEVEKLRLQAESDAQALEKRAASAVQQASRDVILKLKTELEQRMKQVLAQRVGEGMTPEYMAQLLGSIVAAYKSNPKNVDCDKVTVLVNPAVLKQLEARAASEIASGFRIKAELFGDRAVAGGFKVGFSGDDVFFDCSAEAVAGLLAGYLSPKLAKLLGDGDK